MFENYIILQSTNVSQIFETAAKNRPIILFLRNFFFDETAKRVKILTFELC
jgi:hypothetical protein